MNVENELALLPRLKAKALREIHPQNIQSFYHLTECGPVGQCCCGTACFVARHLNPERWQMAAAPALNRAYCLGKCYLSPSSSMDEHRPRIQSRCRVPVVLERLTSGGAKSLDAYVAAGGYSALRRAQSLPPETVIQMVETSGLRGRGGAAFPTGQKWRLAHAAAGKQKHIVANADEGDPGAYIDRLILEEDPHSIIESMAIAAYAVGATQGWIYIRCEYPEAKETFTAAVEEARQIGILGKEAAPLSFDIHVVTGAGSYLCGEETALLNSIAGKRPVAMSRPPYATEQGLFEKPTLINNIETLANIPWIVRHGGEAYRDLGFSNSRGTKLISLNSLFKNPGLYEVEFGLSVRHIFETIGGGLASGTCRGMMIGGPLAGVIPPEIFDTQFGFEELHAIGGSVGHGGIIAFEEHTSIPELVHYIFAFGAFESCGKCTPCRLGARKIEHLFAPVHEARPDRSEARREWEEIVEALKLTSLCGHGTGLAEFAASISRYYGKELDQWFA